MSSMARRCSFSAKGSFQANVPRAIDHGVLCWRMLTWVSLSDRFWGAPIRRDAQGRARRQNVIPPR